MNPQNLSKTKKVLDLFIKVSLWIFALIILGLKFFPNKIDHIISINTFSTIISAISICLLLFWKWFDHTLWKNAFINQHLPDIFRTPIIEGRWEGSLVRDGEEHEFVIEIVQTFTSIYCKTFSRSSSSESVFAEILLSADGLHHQLVYYWKGKTRNMRGAPGNATGEFCGFTILDMTLAEPVKLEGFYFTDRQPDQTRGTISVKFKEKQLKNCFS